MNSIKEIYKIGYGPSSSHTMGPHKAAQRFKADNPSAASFRVTLFGSLAATGRGHLTDVAVVRALAPTSAEILWRPDVVPEYHTNGMLFEALDSEGKVTASSEVYSIGGGTIVYADGSSPDEKSSIEYPHTTMSEIQRYIQENGLSYWEYVEQFEGSQIWEYLGNVWEQMQASIAEGLADDSVLPGNLHVRSKARQSYVRAQSFKPSMQSRALVISYALAVAEQNARGGKVVTAPTCGSCGIVPAVLYHHKQAHGFADRDILKALATAGLFGNVIKENASLSGAEVGCQGEVGSACVMAAAAENQLFGGTPQQIEYAAEIAMEHSLGLTCDPVCGLVQVPCIERNPIAALRAMDSSMYALMSDGRHLISFDKVVDTMKRTGKDLPSLYKETALGGLASVHGRG